MPVKVVARANEDDKHPGDISSVLCHKGNVYSADDFGNLMVWDSDLKKLGEATAHNDAINSLAAIGDTVYSCSNDGTIKAWSLNLKNSSEIANEDCKFWKLAVFENVLYAGNNKGAISLFENNKLTSKFEQAEGIKDMVISGSTLITVKDMQVQIAEIMKGAQSMKKKTLNGNAPLFLMDNRIFFVTGPGTDIAVHENSSKLNYDQLTCHKEAHRMIINAMVGTKRGDDLLVHSAGWDKVIKQWKLVGANLELDTSCIASYVVNALATAEPGHIFAGGEEGHLIKVVFSSAVNA